MAKLRRSRLLQGDAHARPAHVPARRVHVEGPIGLANYLSISRARRVQSLVVITRYDSFLHHIHCLDVVLGSLRAPFGTILLTCLLLTFLLENLIILGFGLHPLLSRFGVYLSFESCREKTCPVELRETRNSGCFGDGRLVPCPRAFLSIQVRRGVFAVPLHLKVSRRPRESGAKSAGHTRSPPPSEVVSHNYTPKFIKSSYCNFNHSLWYNCIQAVISTNIFMCNAIIALIGM